MMISRVKDSLGTNLFMNQTEACVSSPCYDLNNNGRPNVKKKLLIPSSNIFVGTSKNDDDNDDVFRSKSTSNQKISLPYLGSRRPISAYDDYDYANRKTSIPSSEKLLERRSTMHAHSGSITYEQWLAQKAHENRRCSVDTYSLTKRQENDKLRERLIHGKTFDFWKREKDEDLKRNTDKKQKEREQQRKLKLECEEEHEKLIKLKYNEWLLKKHEKYISSELDMIKQLRKKSKDGL